MKTHAEVHTETLERIFHEPNRLTIMSELCAAEDGMAFNDLKIRCELTDGNLSRHLKALEEAGVITIDKKFVDSKPRTTVFISRKGLRRFEEYLSALSNVLERARNSLPTEKKTTAVPAGRLATT